MKTCVVRPWGTANAKATVPRATVVYPRGSSAIVLLRHDLRNCRIAVDPELSPAVSDGSEKPAVVVITGTYEFIEPVHASRRPGAMEKFYEDHTLARVQANMTNLRRVLAPVLRTVVTLTARRHKGSILFIV